MRPVVDASALLAIILDERGAAFALDRARGGYMSTVNLSEAMRRLLSVGAATSGAAHALDRLEIDVLPFDPIDAPAAAMLYDLTRRRGLSFGDRACIALAQRLAFPVLTADRRWSEVELPVEVIRIR